MTRKTRRATELATLAGCVALSACRSQTSSALTACDHAFDVLYVQCAQVAPPSAEIARWRQRYDPLCQSGLALSGISVTPEQLSGCADQVAADGCRLSDALSACLEPGTLGADASCSNSLQCQSNSCSKPYLFHPDSGTSEMLACGNCEPVIPVGQPCGRSVQGQCAPGTQCAFGPAPSCVAAAAGEIGAICTPGSSPSSCKTGLFCDPGQGRCASPAKEGTSCSETAACTYPLTCGTEGDGGLGARRICRSPGQAGAACNQDSDCTRGLVCDVASGKCASLTWAGSEQPCSDTARCLVGNCPAGSASPRCPLIIPDGQTCYTQNSATETCDAFASCVNGVCTRAQGGSCP